MKIKTNVVEMLKCQGKTLVHGVSKDYIRRGKTQSCGGPGSAKQHQGWCDHLSWKLLSPQPEAQLSWNGDLHGWYDFWNLAKSG